jgi:hypothetical protein
MKMSKWLEMSAKPLLFCDVDGVISLWGFGEVNRPAGVWAAVDGIPHFLSTRAAEHLLELSRPFDAVWCTGWEDKADEHLPGVLGVPRGLPHLSFDGATRAQVSARAHWKLEAIEAHAGDRPLAWVDDAFNDACWAWARERQDAGTPTLLVPTLPTTGLDDDAATRLAAFATTVAATPRC